MKIGKLKISRNTAVLLGILIVSALAFLVLRGPYTSNVLKMAILSEFQEAIGRQVIAKKIYINLVPLFVEAIDVKSFDEDGTRVFEAERVKSYLGLESVLKRQVDIKRIVMVRPRLWADRAQGEEILSNVKKHREKREKFFSFKVDAVVIKEGELSFHDESNGAIVTTSGTEAEIVLRDRPRIIFSMKEIAATVSGWPDMKGSIKGIAVISEDILEFEDMTIYSLGSDIRLNGNYSKGKEGEFVLGANLLINSIKNLLGLKNPGDGSILASGSLKLLGDIRNPFIDLKLKGSFFLETLMEFLTKRPRSKIGGLANFDGWLKGHISDLEGSAKAWMKEGRFYGVEVDDAKCVVAYKDGILSFKKGDVGLYGGKGKAEVSIAIPKVRPYTVNVSFKNVNSAKALGLINLSKLKLPPGTVTGELYSSGMRFDPEGRVTYAAQKRIENAIGRVRKVVGDYKKTGSRITLSGFDVSTGTSSMDFDGSLDLSDRALDFYGSLKTDDINDLIAPYYKLMKGSGQFKATVKGTIEDPLIEGDLKIYDAYLDDYLFGYVEGEVSYKKDLFVIKKAKGEAGQAIVEANGTVEFPKARKLLDLEDSRYFVDVTLKRANMRGVLRVFGSDVPVKGSVDAVLAIRDGGLYPAYAGHVSVSDAVVYGRTVSHSEFNLKYDAQGVAVENAMLTRDDSELRLDGSIRKGGSFNFTASSDGLLLSDLLVEDVPISYGMAFEAEGSGTFEEPYIKASLKLMDGEFKSSPIGGGMVEASLEGRSAAVYAKLFDGTVEVKGDAILKGDLPWGAEIAIGRGRYEFLIGHFMKTYPEDLMLSMGGRAKLHGTRNSVNASAVLDSVNLNMFGQGFINDSEILVSLENRKLVLSKFNMKSGDSLLRMKGNVVLNKSYDLVIEGSSSLAALGIFSEKVKSVRGRADFVIGIRGNWENPTINGGLAILDGALAIKNIPQRVSAINGYVYVDDQRAVIQELVAEVGGGNVEVTGFIYLDGIRLDKAYLDTLVDDVSITVSRGFALKVNGNLLLKGSTKEQDITGELSVKRAKYRKRLEWKSWLLEAGRRRVSRVEAGWQDNVRLNVKVLGEENITVDNNIARAPMKVDMIVRGDLGKPLLFGRIESSEGKVYFRNSEFRIMHATADYADASYRDPFIDVMAETSIKGYHVWLNLEGRIEHLDLRLSSDPPLDEVEILGLLTYGEFGEYIAGLESGIGAAEATYFLTGKLQDVFEERFTEVTGFDRFQVDPYVSRSTGTVTPRVTVSKKLAGERLFVTYATTGNEQELNLEYVLNENVSLLGRQDERGSMGGDVKFRFQFE
jgi:translocation and assembly module TamB